MGEKGDTHIVPGHFLQGTSILFLQTQIKLRNTPSTRHTQQTQKIHMRQTRKNNNSLNSAIRRDVAGVCPTARVCRGSARVSARGAGLSEQRDKGVESGLCVAQVGQGQVGQDGAGDVVACGVGGVFLEVFVEEFGEDYGGGFGS